MTAADYYQTPEDGSRFELIEGELHEMTAPTRKHQQVLIRLSTLLFNHAEQSKNGEVNVAPFDVELDALNVVQPDILYVAPDRMSIFDDHGAKGAPNLVVEILSTSSARRDRVIKRQLYARAGVEEMWLIDPDAERVEVWLLQEDANHVARLYEVVDTFQPARFAGLEIRVADLFGGNA